MSDRDRQIDNRGDEPVDTAELRLVEALYGESPDADVDGDLLASYQELRSMFSELPDEEPPAAITAKLVSAAAEAVKASEPARPGLWARLLAFFEPIAAHPALAAAASLMLVVTIGGVLVLTGRSDVAEPETSPSPSAEERRDLERAPVQADPTPPPAEPADTRSIESESTEPVAKDEAPEPKPARVPEREGREGREESSRQTQATGKKVDRGPGSKTGVRGTLKNSRGKGKTGLDFSGGALDVGDGAEGDLDAPEDDDKRSTTAPTMQPQKPARTDAELESLTSRGRKAAAKGDCAAVRSFGARVQKLDAAHYRDVYRRDASIDACYRAQKKAPSSFK